MGYARTRSNWASIALSTSLLLMAASGQACTTVTLESSIPTNANVSLKSYSYCAGTLNVTAYISNLCYNKIVKLYYTDSNGDSTPLTTLALDYQGPANADGTWENWGTSSSTAYIDGVSKLLNITYNAVDISKTYFDVVDVSVQASGGPPPVSTAPVPYATPKGFSKDITNWLAATKDSEAWIAKNRMFDNINVPGAAPGTVIAAQSYSEPDYAYNWVRDAALTMDVVEKFYEAALLPGPKKKFEKILFQYAQARADEQNDPNLTFAGLGEPKFWLNNTAFTGPWGRPQNDGPATSAITLIEFANAYLAAGGSIKTVREKIWDSTTYASQAPTKRDLLFVASNWTYASFDPWEEVSGDNFYNRLIQRRALLLGSQFATKLGDASTAATLSREAKKIEASLAEFWNPARNLILYIYGPVLRGKSSYKDIAVVLGVLHGYNDDNLFSYTDDKVLASAYQIATSFLSEYGIAGVTKDASGNVLGIPVGRYPEDVYDGVGTSLGNPWYLATSAMAELFYRITLKITDTDRAITITSASLPFWTYFSPAPSQSPYKVGQTFKPRDKQFQSMIASLQGWGDAFLRRVKYHVGTEGRLTEQYNRNTGISQGAKDLTWSYAAVLTAGWARAEATGNWLWKPVLANLG